jgi:hypothetical protein
MRRLLSRLAGLAMGRCRNPERHFLRHAQKFPVQIFAQQLFTAPDSLLQSYLLSRRQIVRSLNHHLSMLDSERVDWEARFRAYLIDN